LLAGCAPDPVVQSFAGTTMGSTYEVKFVSEQPIAEVRSLVARELQAFDVAFSNWREGSEIARVNAHASTEPMPASARFAAVLPPRLRIDVETGGTFDPTVKPLSDLYRAVKNDPTLGLTDEQLLAAKERVGYRVVAVKDGVLIKQRADVQLDLDGVVAGAAADALAEQFSGLGIDSFYLQITGEVLCRGVKPDG